VRPNGHPRRGGPAVLPAGVAKLLFLWMRRDKSGEIKRAPAGASVAPFSCPLISYDAEKKFVLTKGEVTPFHQ